MDINITYNLASNPCELNCVPRGENFYYRHNSAVVDGTPCYVGRTDVCVEGKCRVRRKEFVFISIFIFEMVTVGIFNQQNKTHLFVSRT